MLMLIWRQLLPQEYPSWLGQRYPKLEGGLDKITVWKGEYGHSVFYAVLLPHHNYQDPRDVVEVFTEERGALSLKELATVGELRLPRPSARVPEPSEEDGIAALGAWLDGHPREERSEPMDQAGTIAAAFQALEGNVPELRPTAEGVVQPAASGWRRGTVGYMTAVTMEAGEPEEGEGE